MDARQLKVLGEFEAAGLNDGLGKFYPCQDLETDTWTVWDLFTGKSRFRNQNGAFVSSGT